MRNARRTIRSTGVMLVALTLAGCADDPAPSADGRADVDLNGGLAALARGDAATARTTADQYLAAHPTGPGAAMALYLRGRSFEQAAAGSASALASNQQQAKAAYDAALQQHPDPALTALVRAGLGNVAYFSDDPATALGQYTAAYEASAVPEDKAHYLLRMGLCEMRLGRFAQADNTFEQVRRNYPGTAMATEAGQYKGTRAFAVLFATFVTPASADQSAAQLRAQGVNPVVRTDSHDHRTVAVTNVSTFDEAKRLKQRFADVYPQALILP